MATFAARSSTTCATCAARPRRSRSVASRPAADDPLHDPLTQLPPDRLARPATGAAPRGPRLRTAAIAAAVLLALLGVIRLAVLTPFSVPTGSMRPTLRPGDHVLVDRVGPRLRGIHRGDVVVVDGSDLLVSEGQRYVVKRVVGVGGDHVVCCDAAGRVTVNGHGLDERRYLFPGDVPSDVRFDVTLPPGRLWLLGDHRSASRDSRALLGQPGGGMIRADRAVGRVVAVAWPPRRWEWLP